MYGRQVEVMFSEMIQSLLNTGGRTEAMQRAVKLNNFVDHSVKTNDINTIYPQDKSSVQSFEKVLSNTTAGNFGSLLLNNTSLDVDSRIYNKDNISNLAMQQLLQSVKSDYGNDTPNPNKAQLLGMINQVSQKYGVDEKLVQALIKQESGFKVNAKSKVGAIGLMQLMPSTAKSLGVKDPYNPVQNVEGGVKYLKSMIDKYNGNIILALAAYNAGPGAVDKYSGVPPYKETQNYVKNILANYL